jgi:hypothetical protein
MEFEYLAVDIEWLQIPTLTETEALGEGRLICP